MHIESIIQQLRDCVGPNRALDGRIALVVGFKKKEEPFIDKTGKKTKKTTWFTPESGDEVRCPFYTSKVDHAVQLLNDIAPGVPYGFVVLDGVAKASVDGEGQHTAQTPALAICIAALAQKMKLDGGE